MKSSTDLMVEELTRLCRLHNIQVTDSAVEGARIHFELLIKWNRKISLTTITSPSAAARQHYFESFFAANFIRAGVTTASDIGSGGGFPGIPISLLKPDIKFTLIESDSRKAAFLGEARRQLGLENLQVLNDRFENIPPCFDLVLTRAIERFESQLSKLLEFSADSEQIIFFLSESMAKQILESGLITRVCEIVLLPESRDRALLIVSRETRH
jgi:16S rRNA (guanine527-N7)-methyltransferase